MFMKFSMIQIQLYSLKIFLKTFFKNQLIISIRLINLLRLLIYITHLISLLSMKVSESIEAQEKIN